MAAYRVEPSVSSTTSAAAAASRRIRARRPVTAPRRGRRARCRRGDGRRGRWTTSASRDSPEAPRRGQRSSSRSGSVTDVSTTGGSSPARRGCAASRPAGRAPRGPPPRAAASAVVGHPAARRGAGAPGSRQTAYPLSTRRRGGRPRFAGSCEVSTSPCRSARETYSRKGGTGHRSPRTRHRRRPRRRPAAPARSRPGARGPPPPRRWDGVRARLARVPRRAWWGLVALVVIVALGARMP